MLIVHGEDNDFCQQPTANSQQLKANSQKPTANRQKVSTFAL
jgi:hypothetical protein